MDCSSIKERMERFPDKYKTDFDEMWKWKNHIENREKSILGPTNNLETFNKLSQILPGWQTYRSSKNGSPLRTLKESLKKISVDYNLIRNYTLLDFEDIPEKPLHNIWNQLGRTKEYEGQTNDKEKYYAIAVTKPLLLLWGQTLAFDCKVRKNLPRRYGILKSTFHLTFDQWWYAMSEISKELQENIKCIQALKELNYKLYNNKNAVPYGRFLDIYYWSGK